MSYIILFMYVIQFQLTMAYLKLMSLNIVIEALNKGYIFKNLLLDDISWKYIRSFDTNKILMFVLLLTPFFNIIYIQMNYMKVKDKVLNKIISDLPSMTDEEKIEYSNINSKLKKILFLMKNKKEWDSREIDYEEFDENLDEDEYMEERDESGSTQPCEIISFEEASKNCKIDIEKFYEDSIFDIDHDRNVTNIDALRNKALLKKRTNRF